VAARRRRINRQSDSQRQGNRVRNLILEREDVRPLAVVALGPEMKAVGHLDQLRCHPNPVAGPADAPFEQVVDVQPPADFRQLDILSAKQERRRPACHLKARHLRQRVDHFFSESVAEVFVLLVSAHVCERQHRNRRSVLARRRRQLGRRVFQDGPHLRHRLKTVPWIGGQTSLDDARERRRRLTGSEHVILARCADAGQEFVEDDAEAEDVGANVEWFARRLFRRHVAGRAHDDAGNSFRHRGREIVRFFPGRPQELGQAEI
jgi:hypothetical protein